MNLQLLGDYYIFYTLFYKISDYNLLNTSIINLILNLIIAYFFIYIYKKFGYFLTSIIPALLLVNRYLIMSSVNFWNPNLYLIFNLLLFIFLFEYIDNYFEYIDNYNER